MHEQFREVKEEVGILRNENEILVDRLVESEGKINAMKSEKYRYVLTF